MKQLVQEFMEPVAMKPGQPKREDYKYERNGTANLFMMCEPMIGWRQVGVTQRRTAIDYAHLLKNLVDLYYPDVDVITVVQDNLNTHDPASLYKAFQPAEARRILDHLDFCYTPRHGSWLNMAEIELSVLGRQCLALLRRYRKGRRIPEFGLLQTEVMAWVKERNQKRT